MCTRWPCETKFACCLSGVACQILITDYKLRDGQHKYDHIIFFLLNQCDVLPFLSQLPAINKFSELGSRARTRPLDRPIHVTRGHACFAVLASVSGW